jgi:hypothetical protein
MKNGATKKLVAIIVVLATSLGLTTFALSQETFPEGPGRDTLLVVCTQCHSLGKMVTAELTADDWQFIVYDMISRGAPVHQEDIADLTKYLQDNFAVDKNSREGE